MPEEKQVVVQDWSQVYLQERPQVDLKPKLKIEDGQQVDVMFLDAGQRIENLEYGASILFNVVVNKVDMVWFVGVKKFSILQEIAHNKPIAGKLARVTRVGKTKKDTRWSIRFLSEQSSKPVLEVV